MGKCHKQSFEKAERNVPSKQNSGLIKHMTTYTLMIFKPSDPKDKWAEYSMKWQLTEEKMQTANKDKTKYLIS